ncbi:MAG: hypothetical protein LBH93_04780, partial [Chitinispirillales bacterium]|nr:hypothetical protein [Chitinispirillales bacterium]
MLAAAAPIFAQLKESRQLTSNNIIALAGGGDTLWAATERGFNYRLPKSPQNEWSGGFEAGGLSYRFFGLGFGGGGAAALISKDKGGIGDSVGFWHFSHADGKQRQKFFRFPQEVRGDSAQPVGGVAYSNGSFWAPFNHGGIVRYDPVDNSVHAIRPADGGETFPQNLEAIGGGADAKAVLMLDVNAVDNSIIVTAPSILW